MEKEIRELLKKAVEKELKDRIDRGEGVQEEPGKKRKTLVDQLNDADKNDIEREKIKVEQLKAEIEGRKIDLEKLKIEAEKETNETKCKWDFYGKVATGGMTLAGSLAGLVFLNKWTKWGFIQEEFGSIAGKTMNNVMREWKIKRI